VPWYVALYWLAGIATLAAALRWGGRPEVTIAAANIVGAVLTRLVRSPLGVRYQQVETAILIIDLLVLAVFLWVSLKSDRWWPLLATALLAPEMLAHVAKAVQPGFLAGGYSIAGLSAYALYPVMMFGIWNSRNRPKPSPT
jgi:hypothetical protein